MNYVYIVECFDTRNGGAGMGGRHIGGSAFLANHSAYTKLVNAEQAKHAAEKNGIAAAIRALPLMGEIPKEWLKK